MCYMPRVPPDNFAKNDQPKDGPMSVRTWCMPAFGLLLMSLSGCTLWHNLQPHRLHRLNQGPPPTLDPEFSQTVPLDGQPLYAAGEAAPELVIRAQGPQNEP